VVGTQDPIGVPAIVPIEPAIDEVPDVVVSPANVKVGTENKATIIGKSIIFIVLIPKKVEGIAYINADTTACGVA
jgi:hypothetical protein